MILHVELPKYIFFYFYTKDFFPFRGTITPRHPHVFVKGVGWRKGYAQSLEQRLANLFLKGHDIFSLWATHDYSDVPLGAKAEVTGTD